VKDPFPDPLLTTHPEDVTIPLGWPPGWKPDTEQLVSVNGTPVIVNVTSDPGGPEVGVNTIVKPTTWKAN
jgi:hypothetical protein